MLSSLMDAIASEVVLQSRHSFTLKNTALKKDFHLNGVNV